jgi:hypothetical protein
MKKQKKKKKKKMKISFLDSLLIFFKEI